MPEYNYNDFNLDWPSKRKCGPYRAWHANRPNETIEVSAICVNGYRNGIKVVVPETEEVLLESAGWRFHGPLALPPSKLPVEKGEWDYQPKRGDLIEMRKEDTGYCTLAIVNRHGEINIDFDYKPMSFHRGRGWRCRLMRAVPAQGGE